MIFKSPTRLHLQKTRFDRTMSLKSNKLPQKRNLYLIFFPRYLGGSFKMGYPVLNTFFLKLILFYQGETIFSNEFLKNNFKKHFEFVKESLTTNNLAQNYLFLKCRTLICNKNGNF